MNATTLILALYFVAALPDGERVCAAHYAQGRNDEAVACYEALLGTSSNPDARVRIMSDLAWAHWRAGRFEHALARFQETLALARQLHDRSAEGRTINVIGLLHQLTGNPELALAHYNEALAIAQETGDRHLLGDIHYHLGWLRFTRQEFDAALRSYEQSLALRRETGDRKAEALTLNGLGMTHASLSQFEKALQYHAEALPIIVESGDRAREADARDHIGSALTRLHRPLEAIEHHTRALQLRRELGAVTSCTFSLSGLARAYQELGRTEEAAARMKEVVDIVEEGRLKLSTRDFRASLYSTGVGHYERYIGLLMDLDDDAGAFSASERSRARLTLDSFGKEHMPLDARQIQSDVIDAESVIVEYALGSERSFAWTVTRGAIAGHELPPRAEIERLAVRLHALLSAGDQRANKREIETLIDRLSATLIAPLKLPAGQRLIVVPDGALFYIPFAALRSGGQVLIERYEVTTAPSASTLALLRSAAAGRTHDGAVLVFADPVFRADDPRVRERGTGTPAPRLDPDLVRAAAATGLRDLRRLPSTRAEAETIAHLARASRKALDFDASRATALSETRGRYRVVHFATHALVNAQQPELSGIVLSLVDRRGASVDGFLRVADLTGLEVQSDLIVLSACRTAMGKQLRGEGIVGLVSAFMHAGAPRVVASYWDVKDAATAELMKRFYRGMFAAGLSPAAALRAAQRSMRREERFQSPYYWAAFSLHGLP